MKTTLLGILLVTLVGCGGSSADDLTKDEHTLQGGWIFPLANGGAFGLNFDGHAYSAQLLSPLGDGRIGDQAEKGTYAAGGGEISFAPVEWTCVGASSPYSFSLTVSPTTMTLSDATSVAVMTRNTEPPGGAAVLTFGCFQSDGTFAEHPLASAQ